MYHIYKDKKFNAKEQFYIQVVSVCTIKQENWKERKQIAQQKNIVSFKFYVPSY